jgi:hypothetical protein
MSPKEITFLVLALLTAIPTFILIRNYHLNKDDIMEFVGWATIAIVLLTGWVLIGTTAPLGNRVTIKYHKIEVTKSSNNIYVELLDDSTSKDIKHIAFNDKKNFDDNIDETTIIYRTYDENIYGFEADMSTQGYYYLDNLKIRNYSKD